MKTRCYELIYLLAICGLFFLYRPTNLYAQPSVNLLMPKTNLEALSQQTLERRIAAERIRTFYEGNLFRLAPKMQGHFAIRLYRSTGNPQYLNPIAFYYLFLKERFVEYVSHLDSPSYMERVSHQILLDKFGPLSKESRRPKTWRRVHTLKAHLPFVFKTEILYLAYEIKNLKMHAGSLNSYYKRAIDYLSQVRFRDFLFHEDVIKDYAPKAVNFIYFLKDLGLDDLEAEFEERFKAVYMNVSDSKLDHVSYENKIYGLTHFIIAGSNYYQTYVPSQKYQWILDYFSNHLETILSRTKPDAVAEVGLCFKLSGQPKHPVVHRTQKYILEALDPRLGIIPCKSRELNLNCSEHRNVLAYLILSDFDRLYPGPRLTDFTNLPSLRAEEPRGERNVNR